MCIACFLQIYGGCLFLMNLNTDTGAIIQNIITQGLVQTHFHFPDMQ